MADAVSPRRQQYVFQATNRRTNEHTKGQTKGHCHRVKSPFYGGGL